MSSVLLRSALLAGLATLALAALAAPSAASPVVTIYTPSPSTVTNVPWVILTGHVEPVNSTADLNGTALVVDAGGNVSFNATLFEGLNTLGLTALDWEGNSTTAYVAVLLDTVAPTLDVTSPADEDTLTNENTMAVIGTVQPSYDSVSVNGQTAALDGGGNFLVYVALADGLNIIHVTATDAATNEVEVWRNVTYDRYAPFLQVSSPVDQLLTNLTTATVEGRTEVDAVVSIQGHEVSVDSVTGAFSTSVALEDLFSQTENLIVIRAVDGAGNVAYENRTVVVDTHSPSIEFEFPPEFQHAIEEGLPLSITTINVAGRTDSTDASITIAGQEVPLEGLSFSRVLVLAEGLNVIIVTATDQAGNSREVALHVTRDTIEPTCILDGPLQLLVITNRTTLPIQGYADTGDVVVYVIFENARGEQISEALATAPDGDPVQYRFAYNLSMIGDGHVHSFAVRCVDLAGNSQTQELSYQSFVSPPVLEVDAFPSTVTGAFVWVNGSTGPGITHVQINEEFFEVVDQLFSVHFQLPQESGTYWIRVAIRDDAGNTNEWEGEVTLQLQGSGHEPPVLPSPPSVEIAPASHGALEYEAGHSAVFEISVYGHLPDDVSIRWYLDDTLVGDGDRVELTDLVAGNYTVRLEVGNATWNVSRTQEIRVLAAEVDHPPLPADDVVIEGPNEDHLEEGDHAVFEANFDGELPDDAAVQWFLDGALVGNGSRLVLEQLQSGNHTLLVVASNSTWNVSYEIPLDVAASAPPTLPSQQPDYAAIAALSGLAGLAVFGAFAAGTERGRYRIWWAIAAAIVGTRRPPSPLDHFLRGRLYQVISEDPGIHYSELRRRAKASNGAAAHHLHVLERAELIRAVNDGTKTRFYTTEKALDDDTYGLSESDKAVLSTVEAAPGLSQGELSERLDRSLSTVNRSVDRLAALGYVKTEHQGRTVTVFPRAGGGAPAGAIHILPGDE